MAKKLKQRLCINLERWDGDGDGREVQKGGDIGIPMADSGWGLTENNKILQSNKKIKKNNFLAFCNLLTTFYVSYELRSLLIFLNPKMQIQINIICFAKKKHNLHNEHK